MKSFPFTLNIWKGKHLPTLFRSDLLIGSKMQTTYKEPSQKEYLMFFPFDTTKIRHLFVPTKFIAKKIGIKRNFNIRTQNKRNRNKKEKKTIRASRINESKVKERIIYNNNILI